MRTHPPATRAATLAQLVAQVSAEVAAPLTQALERARALATGQTLSSAELAALLDEVTRARRAGILGQQIARLAAGDVRQTDEPVDLTRSLLALLDEHRRERPAAVEIHEQLADVTVMGDTSLVGLLLRATIEWCGGQALTPIELRLDERTGAAQAVVTCRFTEQPRERGADDGLSWHLMQFACDALGAQLAKEQTSTQTTLSLRFERLVRSPGATVASSLPDSRSLAGRQVLVMAAERDIRHQVRQAVHGLDLMVDYVTSVDAARDYCADGLPHAVVYASTMAGLPLERLRNALLAVDGAPPFIEIAAQGHDFEPHDQDHAGLVARLGLDGLARALPAALAQGFARRR